MSAGIYCEEKNVYRHIELDNDGMVYCQHCYRELKAKNERLNYEIKNIMINIFELWEFYTRQGDDRANEYKKIFDDLNKVVSGE